MKSAKEILEKNLLEIEDNYDMSEDERRIVNNSMLEYAKQFIEEAAKIANSWENTDSIGNSIIEELTEQLK